MSSLSAQATLVGCGRLQLVQMSDFPCCGFAGAHAAELLAASLPRSHRVILIDKNRCVAFLLLRARRS
jgi:hypothetical protein